ncbi:hypothetical protein [Spirosoma pomorum]
MVAAGLPGEGGRAGLVDRHAPVDQAGVLGLDKFARGQGLAILAHVEDAPEAVDDDSVTVGIGGGDGLSDQGAGLDADGGDGGQHGLAVWLVDDDDLHVAGDLADEHAVAPLFDDEGEVELALLAGGVPGQLTGAGVDREGRCATSFAGAAKAGRVLVDRNRSITRTIFAQSFFWHAQAEGQAVAIGVEGGRVVDEALAHAGRVKGRVEQDRRRVQAQLGINENRRRNEKTNVK